MTIVVDEALLARVERHANQQVEDNLAYPMRPDLVLALVRHIRAQAERIAKLEERVDLDVDEFLRIKAELGNFLVGIVGAKVEVQSKAKLVAQLCDRAVVAGRQRVPLIVQRDNAELERGTLRVQVSAQAEEIAALRRELDGVKQELKRRNYPDSIPPHIQVRMILDRADGAT